MKIIKATKNNIQDIIFLNSFVQKIHANNYPDLFKSLPDDNDITSFYNEILDKEENYILLAVKGDKAIGYLWAELQQKPENPFKYEQKQVYIHQIAVDEESRGHGTGYALLSKLESIAKQNGITNFALDSWIFNKDAHSFFEQLGFTTYKINMWKKEKHLTHSLTCIL